jgi:hypothetical protein
MNRDQLQPGKCKTYAGFTILHHVMKDQCFRIKFKRVPVTL